MTDKDKRLTVFTTSGGKHFLKVGTAWELDDGSLDVHLWALPVDGRLNIREPANIPRSEAPGESPSQDLVCPNCGCDEIKDTPRDSMFFCPECAEDRWRIRLCTREVYQAAEKAKGGPQ